MSVLTLEVTAPTLRAIIEAPGSDTPSVIGSHYIWGPLPSQLGSEDHFFNYMIQSLTNDVISIAVGTVAV